MKKLHLVLLVALPFFSSCLKDTCRQEYTYRVFTPVYMSYASLRQAVASLPATEIQATGKIYYKAPYLFVNEPDRGIHIIDNSNPSAPQPVSFIQIPGNLDIAVKDQVLYADSYIDLVALDISDPLHVKEIWRDEAVFPQRKYNGWFADPSRGVVVDWVEHDTTLIQDCAMSYPILFFYDVVAFYSNSSGTSGSATTSTGSSPGSGVAGSMARFAISADHLYCLSSGQLNLYHIQNASLPAYKGLINMASNVETLFAYGEHLFVGTTTGVSIYNNSVPSSPTLVSSVPHVTGCDPVVVEGDYAYSTIHSGNLCGQNMNRLYIIDIHNVSNPVEIANYEFSNPYGVGIDAPYLFVCDDEAGLAVYDASNPEELIWKQTVQAGATRDVIPLEGLLLLVTTTGLYQFDYTSGTLHQISFLPVSGQ